MPVEKLMRIKDDKGNVLIDLTPEQYAVYEQVAKDVFGRAFPEKTREARVPQDQGWIEARKGELWKRGRHTVSAKTLSLVSKALAKIGRGTAQDVAAAAKMDIVSAYRILGLMQFLKRAQTRKVGHGATTFELRRHSTNTKSRTRRPNR